MSNSSEYEKPYFAGHVRRFPLNVRRFHSKRRTYCPTPFFLLIGNRLDVLEMCIIFPLLSQNGYKIICKPFFYCQTLCTDNHNLIFMSWEPILSNL